MRFIALFKTARRDRVGENKKCLLGAEFSIQSFDEKIVFVVEHCLETNAADVAVSRSINRVAECHVGGGHGLGDRAGCAAAAAEAQHYVLPGGNVSRGPTVDGVELRPL